MAGARWCFNRGAASRDRYIVELLDLFWRVALERHRGAIRDGCWFIIDGLSHDESGPTLSPVHEASVAAAGYVQCRFANAERAQNGVLEALGALDIVRTNHRMKQHRSSPIETLFDRNRLRSG